MRRVVGHKKDPDWQQTIIGIFAAFRCFPFFPSDQSVVSLCVSDHIHVNHISHCACNSHSMISSVEDLRHTLIFAILYVTEDHSSVKRVLSVLQRIVQSSGVNIDGIVKIGPLCRYLLAKEDLTRVLLRSAEASLTLLSPPHSQVGFGKLKGSICMNLFTLTEKLSKPIGGVGTTPTYDWNDFSANLTVLWSSLRLNRPEP